jgi:hypothetical protein
MKTRIELLNLKHMLLAFGLLVSLQACKNGNNEGAKIKGKILAIDANNDSTYVADHAVFLVSDTGKEFALKRKSGKKGGFKFKNIPAGEYKLMVYTNTSKNKSKDTCIVKKITVSKEQKLVEIDPIITFASVANN